MQKKIYITKFGLTLRLKKARNFLSLIIVELRSSLLSHGFFSKFQRLVSIGKILYFGLYNEHMYFSHRNRSTIIIFKALRY